LKKAASIHSFKLKGELKVCEDCTVEKARQKHVNQDWKEGSQALGERVYLDISCMRVKRYGGSRFGVLIVDDYTDYCWSIFYKTKGDLNVKVMTRIRIDIGFSIIVTSEKIGGAMFMAQNSSSGMRTCHVGTRYHFIRENVVDGIIKIEFVKTMENDSDFFTETSRRRFMSNTL
jgi:hypothetical protein